MSRAANPVPKKIFRKFDACGTLRYDLIKEIWYETFA